MPNTSGEAPLLETLSFESTCQSHTVTTTQQICCLFCSEHFEIDDQVNRDLFLKHLVTEHQFVIADVQLIANFER